MNRPRSTWNRPRKDDAPFPIFGCLGIAVMLILEIVATIVLVYVVIESGIPWVIDVVLDAVEEREERQ